MTPAALYDERIEKNLITPDAAQADVMRALDDLCRSLSPAKQGERIGEGVVPQNIISKFFNFLRASSRSARGERRQGIYIYGPVGRGKSMLMDLFYECAPTPKKRRVHFHAFMQELHHELHLGRQSRVQAMNDALLAFARHVARQATLLCFDEFHVTDVADAMLLGRLFHALWELGVVIVSTSNWAPDDLYKDGLQRDRFLPFIAELKTRMTVCHLLSDTDYRLARLRGYPVYYFPLGPHATERMEFLFNDLIQWAELSPLELQLPGRRWIIRRAAKGIVWLDFADACAANRGAPDYLALAAAAQVVFLDNVPIFTDDMRNEVKRLMTLIDILYEQHARVVIAAEALPDQLYPADRHSFEFQRTVSRLMEMQSAEYLAGVIGVA